MLGLPGSAYLYQGEELGLHEVAGIPPDRRQDPAFFRNPGVDIGRDGCRVPLPWTPEQPSFGFGAAEAHLPQPDGFAAVAVSLQEADPASVLALYRAALRLRRELRGGELLEWAHSEMGVVHFRRPGGWEVATNFGSRPAALPAGEVLLASTPLDGNRLPADTTVWLRSAQ